jgi:hypothetical protein
LSYFPSPPEAAGATAGTSRTPHRCRSHGQKCRRQKQAISAPTRVSKVGSAPFLAEIGAEIPHYAPGTCFQDLGSHRRNIRFPAVTAPKPPHPTERPFFINDYQSINYQSNRRLWDLVTFRKYSIIGDYEKQATHHSSPPQKSCPNSP